MAVKSTTGGGSKERRRSSSIGGRKWGRRGRNKDELDLSILSSGKLRDEEAAERVALLDDGRPLRDLVLNGITVLENNESTNNLLFHPYEPLLMVADDGDVVSAFNYEENTRLVMLVEV